MLNLHNRNLLAALMVATVLTMLAMRSFDGLLTNEICPNGIVSFEFAKSEACAQTILNSWDTQAKSAAGLSLGLDYLFLLLYSSTLALLLYRLDQGAKSKLKTWLIGGVFLAAAFDGIENFALAKMLLGDVRQVWASVAYVFATVKFALLAVAGGYLLVKLTKTVFMP